MDSIKQFNVKIDGNTSETFKVGVDATNVEFSNKATDPYKSTFLESAIPDGMAEKASNKIYGNAYIRLNDSVDVDGIAYPDATNYKKAMNGLSAENITQQHLDSGSGAFSISYGIGSVATGHNAISIGFDCEANGWASHAEGWKTTVDKKGQCAHAEGTNSKASHYGAHAEGDHGIAGGHTSHAEGRNGHAYGMSSHAEGVGTKIEAEISDTSSQWDLEMHDTNFKRRLNGQGSHAEGLDTTINKGAYCHAEGVKNTINQVYGSTAMGEGNEINSNTSVVMGSYNTIPANYPNSLFIGKYGEYAEGNTKKPPAFVIGGGIDGSRSNLLSISYAGTKAASPTNRGDLIADNLNASFGSVKTADLKGLKVIKFETVINRNGDNGSYFAFGDSSQTHWAHGISKVMRIRYFYYPAIGYLMVTIQPFAGSNASTGCVIRKYDNDNVPTICTYMTYQGTLPNTVDTPSAQHPFQHNMPKELVAFIGNGGGYPGKMYYEGYSTSMCFHEGGGISFAYLDIRSLIMQGTYRIDDPGHHCFQIKTLQPLSVVNNNKNYNYNPWFRFEYFGEPVQE